MAYIPGFKHDLFISYAHVDNLNTNEERGWVEQFKERLEVKLSMRVGRPGVVKIWCDPALNGAHLFDRTIQESINSSAIFLALTSTGYLASEYCRQELRWFCQKARSEPHGMAVGDRMRVLNLLLNNIPYREWPEEYGRTLGFPLHDSECEEDLGYASDPMGRIFEQQLRKVVDAIHGTMIALREAAPVANRPGSEPSSENKNITPIADFSHTVFLADTADSLRVIRKRVMNDLQQQEFALRATSRRHTSPGCMKKKLWPE
jgi:hypothetical protein